MKGAYYMVSIFSAAAQRVLVRAAEGIKPIKSLHERYERSKAAKKLKLEATSAKDDLISQMNDTKKKMQAIQSCFDLETNFDMIDVYIMELSSLEKRYDFLIKEAKRKNITA